MHITRRNFIHQGSMFMLGAGVIGGNIPSLAHGEDGSPQPTMIIDLNRCTGCQSCVVACKSYNKTATGQFNTRIIQGEQSSPLARATFVPVQCNQCSAPPCIPVCPNDATFKLGNGIVVTDWDLCTASGECIRACPYDARASDPNYQDRVDKCDFCLDRIEQGMAPACVEACSAGARLFGDRARPDGEFADYLRHSPLAVRNPEQETGPTLLYVPLS